MPGAVSVVVTTYNHTHFLRAAIESVIAQTAQPAEIIVVDDGSTDHPELVTTNYASVHLIQKTNQGLAAARNTGWLACRGDFVTFLDADDRLLPNALDTNLSTFAAKPVCGFVYAAYRMIDAADRAISPSHFEPVGNDAYASLLRTNCVAMHATAMYRRDRIDSIGGFNAALGACEDYDAYLRLSRLFPVGWSNALIAEYRIHRANMSRNPRTMLKAVLAVLGKQRQFTSLRDEWRTAYAEGIVNWTQFYSPKCAPTGINPDRPDDCVGVQLARAVIEWGDGPYREAGFPLVMHYSGAESALLVHPLPDLATTARVIAAVPAGQWEVHAECALLDPRAPPVSFRVGADPPVGAPLFGPWIDVASSAETGHIAFPLPALPGGAHDLLLQTRLKQPETAAYAHAVFRNVCLFPRQNNISLRGGDLAQGAEANAGEGIASG